MCIAAESVFHHTFLVLNLGFNIFYSITSLNLNHWEEFQLEITTYNQAKLFNTNVSGQLTSRVMVFPVRVFTKICILQQN